MSKVCSVKPDVKCGTGLLVCTLMNSVQRTGGGAGRGFSGSKPAKYVRQIFILSWLDWPYWQKARSDDRIALFGRSLTPIGCGQKTLPTRPARPTTSLKANSPFLGGRRGHLPALCMQFSRSAKNLWLPSIPRSARAPQIPRTRNDSRPKDTMEHRRWNHGAGHLRERLIRILS